MLSNIILTPNKTTDTRSSPEAHGDAPGGVGCSPAAHGSHGGADLDAAACVGAPSGVGGYGLEEATAHGELSLKKTPNPGTPNNLSKKNYFPFFYLKGEGGNSGGGAHLHSRVNLPQYGHGKCSAPELWPCRDGISASRTCSASLAAQKRRSRGSPEGQEDKGKV